MTILKNNNYWINALRPPANFGNEIIAERLVEQDWSGLTRAYNVLFDRMNRQKDDNTLQVQCDRFAGSKSRQIVAPGAASPPKLQRRRTKRNPGKTGSLNEVSNCRSRHGQTRQNSGISRPIIFNETFIRGGKNRAIARLCRTSSTCVCLLQQQNNESAILIGRGSRNFCHFSRGGIGDLETFLMAIYPRVSLWTAAAVLRPARGYYLPALPASPLLRRNAHATMEN
ncbi:MAG: hypothetical protein HZA50_10955 [Planctomycetes bacterium]|nr:hypothetical protein [Planctomycetota bacterium]